MVRLPFSNMDFAVAKVLMEKKYIKDVKKKMMEKKGFLEIELNPREDHSSIGGFKMLSTPGRRLYVGYRALKPVRQGYGMGVVSTSKGVMTNLEARKNKLGGEYLFQIW